MTTQANRPDDYQVIVSNVGTVYSGNYATEAKLSYEEHKADSINVIGRAAGEDVTLMYKGEPMTEYQGVLSAGRDNADTEGCGDSNCPACKLRRALHEEALKRARHKDGELGYLIDVFIQRLNKAEGIEVEEEQRAPLYKALMNAIVDNVNGG